MELSDPTASERGRGLVNQRLTASVNDEVQFRST